MIDRSTRVDAFQVFATCCEVIRAEPSDKNNLPPNSVLKPPISPRQREALSAAAAALYDDTTAAVS
jgi:hypothetical protein